MNLQEPPAQEAALRRTRRIVLLAFAVVAMGLTFVVKYLVGWQGDGLQQVRFSVALLLVLAVEPGEDRRLTAAFLVLWCILLGLLTIS